MQKPTETKTTSVLDKRLPPLLPPVTIKIWWNKSYRQKKLLTHEIMVGRWKPLYLPQDSCHKHARICQCWGAPAHWIAPFCVKILYQSCWLGTLWYTDYSLMTYFVCFSLYIIFCFKGRFHKKKLLVFWILSKLPPPRSPQLGQLVQLFLNAKNVDLSGNQNDSFYWPKMHLWTVPKKFGEAPPPHSSY